MNLANSIVPDVAHAHHRMEPYWKPDLLNPRSCGRGHGFRAGRFCGMEGQCVY